MNRRDLLLSLLLAPLGILAATSLHAVPALPRRLRLELGPGARPGQLDGRVAPGKLVRVSSTTGRVRLVPGGGALAGDRVEVTADRSGRIRLGLEALAVGEPEQPGDRLRVETAAGTAEIEVWIEPLLGQWRGEDRGAGDGSGIELGIVGVHAALVRVGERAEVLLVSPPRRRRPDGHTDLGRSGAAWDLDAVDRCELARLDAETLSVRTVPFESSGLPPVNLFCSGHAHLPDGRLLFAGGHVSSRADYPATAGALHVFDSRGPGEGWRRVPVQMARERWYPTLVALPEGRVLIASGSTAPLSGSHHDHDPWTGYYRTVDAGFEIYDPATDQLFAPPERTPLVDLDPGDPNPPATYPALFVLPGGAHGVLFVQEAHRGWLHELGPAGPAPRMGTRPYRMVATRGSRSYPHYGSAVLLPFADGAERLRVLVVGGQHERDADHRRIDDDRPTTATAEIFDYHAQRATDRQSGWRAVGPMDHRRALGDATLLSDGTVLVSGGIRRGWANQNREEDAVLDAEIFDPATERFWPAAKARLDRRYHATALLLPDGTVLKMGSTGGFGAGRDEKGRSWTRPRFDAERFYPATLWRGPRPVILGIDGAGPETSLAHGARFELTVTTAEPEGLRLLALRLGSVTHGLDMDQRAVFLTLLEAVPGPEGAVRLVARAPATGSVAPPGDYQLVVIDGIGVPSRGRLVRLAARFDPAVRLVTPAGRG